VYLCLGWRACFRCDPCLHFLNFLRSQSSTARCSSWPARRICESSQIAGGFEGLRSRTPSSQVEHSVWNLDSSPFPAVFLSALNEIRNLALSPVKSSMSPGLVPHILQNRSPWSRKCARCSAEIPGAKVNSEGACKESGRSCHDASLRTLWSESPPFWHRRILFGRLNRLIRISMPPIL